MEGNEKRDRLVDGVGGFLPPEGIGVPVGKGPVVNLNREAVVDVIRNSSRIRFMITNLITCDVAA